MAPNPLIPVHCGDSKPEIFRIARLIHDITVRFCNRYIEKHSRSHKRMIEAARNGLQNIADGYEASASSRTTEFNLSSVARASLDELRLDYEKFLRQNNLVVWPYDDHRRKKLIGRKCTTVDEIALWVLQEHRRKSARQLSSAPSLPEITANAALTLTIVACNLLDHQMTIPVNELAE
jgi:hypothetical protein